jgi:hypothetical protein
VQITVLLALDSSDGLRAAAVRYREVDWGRRR